MISAQNFSIDSQVHHCQTFQRTDRKDDIRLPFYQKYVGASEILVVNIFGADQIKYAHPLCLREIKTLTECYFIFFSQQLGF